MISSHCCRDDASSGQRRATQFKELALKGALSAKSDTSGAIPKPGDLTNPLDTDPCVTMSPGQGDMVVSETNVDETSGPPAST